MKWRESIAIMAVICGLLLGILSIFGAISAPIVSWWGLQIALTIECLFILIRSFTLDRRSRRLGRSPWRIGSTIFAAGSLIAVALPGEQLVTGLRESRLAQLGFPVDPINDVQTVYALWMLALLVFAVGEEVGVALARWHGDRVSVRSESFRKDHRTAVPIHSGWMLAVLLILGAVGAAVATTNGHSQTIATRGNIRGQGLLVGLEYCFPLATCLAILLPAGRAKWLGLSLGSLGSAYLIWFTGARSSLMLVGAALLAVLLYRQDSRMRLRTIALGVLGMYVAAAVIVAIPLWRAGVANGSSPSFFSTVLVNSTNPLAVLASTGGLDTVDGFILSTKVDPHSVGVSPTDPLKAVIELVPYQIWPDKPEFLGPAVTHYYLNFGGGAGIFLSGPGYAYIVFGGTVGMAVMFFILGVVSARLFDAIPKVSLWMVLFMYFWLRFLFAGDAFDAFQTIEMALVISASYLAMNVVAAPSRRLARPQQAMPV